MLADRHEGMFGERRRACRAEDIQPEELVLAETEVRGKPARANGLAAHQAGPHGDSLGEQGRHKILPVGPEVETGDQVPGIGGAPAVLEAQRAAQGHLGAVLAGQGLEAALQKIREQDVIVVEEKDPVPSGSLQPHVPGMARSVVPVQCDEAHAVVQRREAHNGLPGVRVRAVVNHQNLQGRQSLVEGRQDGLTQEGRPVPAGDDD